MLFKIHKYVRFHFDLRNKVGMRMLIYKRKVERKRDGLTEMDSVPAVSQAQLLLNKTT